MSGYEVEHNISTKEEKPEHPPRRPDLSTFFSTLELVDTSDPQTHHNVHATPQPENMAAAFRLLANAFEMMGGRAAGEQEGTEAGHSDLLEQMIETLRQNADNPPAELQGVPDSFIDELDRVPRKKLTEDHVCAICHNPHTSDEHPLVVALPCKGRHWFDIECITPWLKMQPTCPLDRETVYRKKQPPPPVEDSEEEYDDMYA
ncbi:hypothetical protein BU24DRAFT_456828 [Aaosphaeria arxii CBS 175.79]|uniref:RING-type domain-containing protein n=1 Tax=Aaosphaeria arxii CBS 175.79 TaxID=1450172 RepID=A0A6A5Y6F4_9PLEO|nr:uncharacterized protein BU24DRAFT_456828 [Aaosphaeria arxii CBS 175.79]KAF2020793.1 hypothetical protein BU24DRAFT_456828 [Aaosphaeria arxii CBS 175.79]